MTKNPQESAAWLKSRIGKVTASRIGDIVATSKRDPSKKLKAYDDYLTEIVLERLTGRATDHYVTPAMEVGMVREDAAALEYAMQTGADVAFSDFVEHPSIPMCGASPDRLVGSDGLLEIKCPQPKAHMDFLMSGAIKPVYYWQTQWQMVCTGRQWCDFMSYSEDFAGRPHLMSRIKRVERAPQDILNAESLVLIFMDEVAAQVAKMDEIEERAKNGEREAA